MDRKSIDGEASPSMAVNTASAFDIICRLDCDGKLDEAPQNKKQKVATGLLRDKLYKQDFTGPISLRASTDLGPISRYRVADILPHMKLVSRASRPGLTVGVLRVLCNGLCTAWRFHTEEHDHRCRVGCPNDPDSLSLTLQWVSSFVQYIYSLLETGYCTFTEKPSSPWHDHPCVPAKPSMWNCGDGLHWRFWLCPSAPSKYQESCELWWLHERKNPLYDSDHSCLRSRISGDMSDKTHACNTAPIFRLWKPKAKSPYLPNARSTTRERGNDFRGWAIIYTDGGTRVVNGETLAGWVVIALSMEELISCLILLTPPTLILPSQVPEITPTTPLKWLPWLRHCLSLVLMVRWPEMWNRVMILNTWWCVPGHDPSPHPRTAGARMSTVHAMRPNTGYGLPCNTCTVTQGTWAMTVLIMLQHLVHLALSLATTLPPAGFVIILTHLNVVVAATTSARFWKDCSTLGQKQRRYLKMGVSAVFSIGFCVFLTCVFVSSVILLSASSRASTSLFRTSNGKALLRLILPSFGEYFAQNMWNPLLELLFLEQTSGVIVLFVEIAFSCRFVLDLLCYKEGAHDDDV